MVSVLRTLPATETRSTDPYGYLHYENYQWYGCLTARNGPNCHDNGNGYKGSYDDPRSRSQVLLVFRLPRRRRRQRALTIKHLNSEGGTDYI